MYIIYKYVLLLIYQLDSFSIFLIENVSQFYSVWNRDLHYVYTI